MNETDRLDFRSYQAETEHHAHEFWQVVLPVSGRLDIEIEGRGGFVGGGQGALIAPGMRHAFEASGDNRFLVADVSHSTLFEPLDRRASARRFFPVSPPVKALIDYRSTVPLEKTGLHNWLALLVNALDPLSEEPPDRSSGGTDRAIAYMRDRLACAITIEQLCGVSGMAPHQLTRAFRKDHGISPYAFLTELRLQRADNLIAGSDLPLSEIADLSGFADQSAMTRHMRARGMPSPGARRRALRKP